MMLVAVIAASLLSSLVTLVACACCMVAGEADRSGGR